MAKAKKVLSTVVIALFTVFTVLSYVPAQAKAVTPKLAVVTQPAAEYTPADTINFTVNAPNYTGAVMYRVILYNGTTKQTVNLWNTPKTGYYYAGWTPAGTYPLQIHWAASQLQPGPYSMTVLVKKKGSTAKYEDSITTKSFFVKEAATSTSEIKSLEAAAVSVDQNATAVLPTTVKATLADGTTKDVNVTWGTVDTTKVGDVTVEGTVAGTTLKATAKVTVKAVALSVKSVTAKSATTFEVAFNVAPVDSSKVVFTVKRESTPVTVTTTWNGSVATLTGSVKFAQGNYTVGVKESDKDLGSSNVTIDQEKVAKIEITSDTLAVETVTDNNPSPNTTHQYAYFTYKVLNQYGDDITSSSLASLTWQVPGCVVAPGTTNKGVEKYEATNGLNLLNLGSTVITGIDSNSSVVASKTLKVSASMGTLSDIQLVGLKQAQNKDFRAGSTADFYIDYVAKDMTGNETKDFGLVSAGLFNVALTTSGYANATVVDEDGKAVIKVSNITSSLAVDMPVIFTAITKTGKTSSLTVTLKKQADVTSFTLLAPIQDIAASEAKEIPFAAYDQDGNQVTSFDDIVNTNGTHYGVKYIAGKNFTLSPAYDGATSGLYFVKKSDGNAKLMYKAAGTAALVGNTATITDTTNILTATTNAGKFSQLSIVVRKPKVATSLTIDESLLVTKFQGNAEYTLDNDAFTVKDQYGRTMDLGENAYVKVQATGFGVRNEEHGTYASGVDVPNYDTDGTEYDVKDVYVKAPVNANGGVYNVKFTLVGNKVANNGTVTSYDVTSKTMSFVVVKDSDIKGLTTGSVGKLYTITGETNNVYRNTIAIYGKTSTGEKVVLTPGTFDLGKSNGYVSVMDNKTVASPSDMNRVRLTSTAALPAGTTEQATVVTATTSVGTDVKSTSFTVTVSNDPAVAKEIVADDEITGTDKVTDDIEVNDQYGKNLADRSDNQNFVTFYVNGAKVTGPIDSDLTVNAALGTATGDIVTIVTHNGLTKTFVVTD